MNALSKALAKSIKTGGLANQPNETTLAAMQGTEREQMKEVYTEAPASDLRFKGILRTQVVEQSNSGVNHLFFNLSPRAIHGLDHLTGLERENQMMAEFMEATSSPHYRHSIRQDIRAFPSQCRKLKDGETAIMDVIFTITFTEDWDMDVGNMTATQVWIPKVTYVKAKTLKKSKCKLRFYETKEQE